MGFILAPIFWLLRTLLGLYIFICILAVIFSLLIHLDVMSLQNGLVSSIYSFLTQVTEPAFAWARGFIPSIGGVDFSPLIVILVLLVIREVLLRIEIVMSR